MRFPSLFCLSLLCVLGFGSRLPALNAQSVYVSRLVPGYPQNQYDVLCRIDLFNESSSYVDVSGYWVATRYFMVQLPPQTFVAPYTALRLGRTAYNADLDVVFSNLPTWKVREVSEEEEEGDFVALLSPAQEMVDGFYFGPRAGVNFLPNQESMTMPDGGTRTLSIPDEGDYEWSFLRNRRDPAMAFVRIAQRWWTSSRTRNLLPATQYREVSAKYVDGIATVKWRTLFERDCYTHTLERSTDGKNYRMIEQVAGPINSDEGFDYLLYDASVEKDRLYYYRIANTDKFGYTVYSKPTKIRTQELPGEFTFDIIRSERQRRRVFDVRFSSKLEQQVRVQLMDEELREIAVLFYGIVEAERQTLINFNKELTAGKYYLIVSTEARRYYEPLIIE